MDWQLFQLRGTYPKTLQPVNANNKQTEVCDALRIEFCLSLSNAISPEANCFACCTFQVYPPGIKRISQVQE